MRFNTLRNLLGNGARAGVKGSSLSHQTENDPTCFCFGRRVYLSDSRCLVTPESFSFEDLRRRLQLFSALVDALCDTGACLDHLEILLCVQWVETHPQSQRMRLGDMQAKPHQRITKYPLLLKSVLQNTQDPQVQQTLRDMVRRFGHQRERKNRSKPCVPVYCLAHPVLTPSAVVQRQQFSGEHQRLPEAEGRRAGSLHFRSEGGRIRGRRNKRGN